MTALPEWVRSWFWLLKSATRALSTGALTFFLGLCVLISLNKLAIGMDKVSGLTDLATRNRAEALMVLYAAWHVYHDGHGFMSCDVISGMRPRLKRLFKLDKNGPHWRMRIRPYRYI